MPFPKIENGRVDPQLTNILLAYTNQDYVADKVLPTVPGLKDESGKIPQMGNAHLRIYSSKRSLYDESEHRVNFTINNDNTYDIDYYDLESYVPDRLQAQLQKPFNARNAAQKTVMDALLLERENALATTMADSSVLTNYTTLSGTDQWSDTANSDPSGDIDTGRTSVYEATGREPNTALMSRTVANTLRRHPFFTERAIAYLQGGKQARGAVSMSAVIEIMKAEFDLENVVIAKPIKVSSKEGQTETLASVWGKHFWLYYVPSSPSLFEPSFGYSFQLQGMNRRTDVRRHSNDLGSLVRAMWGYQDNILDVDSAYYIEDAVA